MSYKKSLLKRKLKITISEIYIICQKTKYKN